jgi:uncharacterized membrane protein
MVTLGSKETCALALSLIALADLSIVFNIPVLRQAFVFVLLIFLPGFVLIQLLRVTNNLLDKILFLIGLSVSFLMFVPLVMNFAYPAVGIARPISLVPIATTFSLILGVLSVVAYRTGGFDFHISTGDLRTLTERSISPPVLGAALILVLGILGGLFMRFQLDSLLSLLSMLSIVAIVVVIALSRRVSARYYPLFIVVIALALQYGATLNSPNLFGSDVHYELYFADVVRANGLWNPNFAVSSVSISDYYAMLSVSLLPNVFSLMLNVDTIWVYQLVVPFLFAFVPLALYQLCKTQLKFSSRFAFLAAFFFMSFWAFFFEMPREDIAELFLALTALVIMNKRLEPTKRSALLIVFISSIVVCHYATSYIFLIYLAVLLIGSALLTSQRRQNGSRFIISPTIAVFAVCITFGWYIFASGGASYHALLDVGTHTYHTFFTELFSVNDPYIAAGLAGGVSGLPYAHVLGRYLVNASEAFIAIGFVATVWRRKTSGMNEHFLLLVWASFCIMLVAIAVPPLGTALTSYRVYALMLLFLAPCCVLGVEAIVDAASSWIHVNRDLVSKLKYVLLICVLVPYFLFNYNFIFELTEHPSNYALLPSQTQATRTIEYSDNKSWSYLAYSPIPIESNAASMWLSSTMGNLSVYTDNGRGAEVVGYGHISPNSLITLMPWQLDSSLGNTYFFLGAPNVQQNSIALNVNGTVQEQPISSWPQLNAANQIYSNGLAEIRYRT